jgi:hypothetical protein
LEGEGGQRDIFMIQKQDLKIYLDYMVFISRLHFMNLFGRKVVLVWGRKELLVGQVTNPIYLF